MRDIVNHINYRVKRNGLLILIVYMIFFTMLLSFSNKVGSIKWLDDFFKMTRGIDGYGGVMGINYLSFYDSGNIQVYIYFVNILVGFTLIRLLVCLYQDYQFGKTRWQLLTKNTYAYVLVDSCFIACVILPMYVIFYIAIANQFHTYIMSVNEIKYIPSIIHFEQDFTTTIQFHPMLNMLYPIEPISKIANAILCFTISQILVCLVLKSISVHKKMISFILFAGGILCILWAYLFLSSEVACIVYFVLFMSYLYMGIRTWSNSSMGG